MTNIILCGGSGTRLWPISRTLMPKQFVKLFNDESLFQLTVKRNKSVCEKQFIVSNTEQYFLAVDQLEELEMGQNRFLLEPIGRNTAPAIALACLALDPNEIVLVSPSDHLIKDEISYKKALARAKELASEDILVTFGIRPEYAETGYGYIEAMGENVKAFHEKPDESTAQKYIDTGNFYWNSGMFCFKVGVFLEELKKHSQEIYNMSFQAFSNAKNEGDMIRISHEDMSGIPENSIDYAVMEKSDKVKVVASDIDWSDLGSFDALDVELKKDENGNTKNEHLYTVDSKNNFVHSNERIIALCDVENLVVVDTSDALLISKKGSTQKVKEIVDQLKQVGSELSSVHQTAHRPWGTYTVLDECGGYKVKRIMVKPGKRLSLQKHFHRSEHWIVVTGTAKVTRGNDEFLVCANESTYISIGETHRLENAGKIPLIMIEAQVGEYLGEDDIVRIDDDFKRE